MTALRAAVSRALSRALGVLAGSTDLAVLLVVVFTLFGLNLFWAEHVADSTGHKFCAIVGLATKHPVPKPADPAANPSRQQNYMGYVGAVELGRSLGCPIGKPPAPPKGIRP